VAKTVFIQLKITNYEYLNNLKYRVMNFDRLILLLAALLLLSVATAQRTEEVCGEYEYVASDDITPRQAKEIALKYAKIDAIGKRFGFTVSGQTLVHEKEENGQSSASFHIFADTESKGEWIADTKVTEHEPYINALGMLVYKVSVCGMAREIVGTGIDFSAKVLKNGTESRFESSDFRNGDEIYLSFRSPVDGYLAIYLVDDSETAFCLLPYQNDPTGKMKIKTGKEYVFFSDKHADRNEIVELYKLTCKQDMEYNFMYIIFSPNEFTKANDVHTDQALPRELSDADFQKWLARNRQKDKDMKVNKKSLTIKR
jgi:hypothetical protein